MKEQYLPQFKHRGYEPEKWHNANVYVDRPTTDFKRYCDTIEEAREVLEEVKKQFPEHAHKDVIQSPLGGIASYTDESTAQKMAIAETRIRVRLVTDWQTLE